MPTPFESLLASDASACNVTGLNGRDKGLLLLMKEPPNIRPQLPEFRPLQSLFIPPRFGMSFGMGVLRDPSCFMIVKRRVNSRKRPKRIAKKFRKRGGAKHYSVGKV